MSGHCGSFHFSTHGKQGKLLKRRVTHIIARRASFQKSPRAMISKKFQSEESHILMVSKSQHLKCDQTLQS